ncbi:MAG: hypothetical protein V2I65_15815 [Paracoccaceae bacterium]|jgi:hypothetical protein|nr:hypothetical protein [Paracoccaceae bacterium]
MPKLSLASRDAEKKKGMVSLELVLLFALATLVSAALWAGGAGVMERTGQGANGYEQSLESLKGSF